MADNKETLNCLNCDEEFESAAKPENRKCPKCGAKGEDLVVLEEPQEKPDAVGALEAKCSELENAIRPLAALQFSQDQPEDYIEYKLTRYGATVSITKGDILRARQALNR